MRARLARLALGLYPLAFRRRYGPEMRALLEQTPARAATVVDLLRGALIAHLRPPATLAGSVAPADRVRASASAVLACWVAFAAAGFGFYKTTEGASFSAAGYAHPLLGDARAVPMPRRQLITAAAGAALATAAMVAITLATALYAAALPIDSAALAGTPNGPFQALSASASVVVQAIVMALAAALAATATVRGWRAAADLRGADGPGL